MIQKLLAHLREEAIEAHLRFLAHPLLEGRGVGSRGGRLAEEYIASVFRAAGLLPGAGDGYRQEVPLIGMYPRPQLSFSGSSASLPVPILGESYVLEAGLPQPHVEVESELVFAGFGIHAPEYRWDDFGDADVRGRVLLIRVNDPGGPETPGFFEGRALTYYGRWTYKFEEAARRGAAGALLIHTTESAGYGWNVVRSSNTGEQFQLAGTPRFALPIRGWVTEEVARGLLAASGADPDALFADSESGSFKARPIGVQVHAAVQSSIREVSTANVIGRWEGSDPGRAGGPVILMAHHDHLGMVQAEDGSPIIYPGAYDNGSGVALLLAMAQALAASGVRFARPLVFLASTAEESGLLGSTWYADHPLLPLHSTAGVLNVDGVNVNGPTRDIAPLGVDRSTLGDLVRAAAQAEGILVAPEQHPEQGMFFRQDHFPFARAGVPAIAFDHGIDYVNRPEGWGERWYEEFVSTHYHQPTDAFREEWEYGGATQQGRVMLRVAADAASTQDLPDWKPGSSFARPGPTA